MKLVFARLLVALCVLAGPAQAAKPERVTVEGYAGELMEPALSPDGQTLFFNNSNAKPELTNLHWAVRVNDLTFRYQGEVGGVNTPSLDAVASVANDATFCFISLREYETNLNTLFCGAYAKGEVASAQSLVSLSKNKHGHLIFDAEITSDGANMIFVDGKFGLIPVPSSAQLRWAVRSGDTWQRQPAHDTWFTKVNAMGRVYAPDLSADGKRLLFTRLKGMFPFYAFTMWQASRNSTHEPFGNIREIKSLSGVSEAATFDGPDHILFHHKDAQGHRLYRMPLPD
jgi:hypothetical protein